MAAARRTRLNLAPTGWWHAARAALAVVMLALHPAQAEPASSGAAGGTVWRCGNHYSHQPCADGRPVQTDDVRSAAQRQQAEDVARQEQALARRQTAEREARERQPAHQAPLAGIGAVRPDAAAAAASHPTRRGSRHGEAGRHRKKEGTASARPEATRARQDNAQASPAPAGRLGQF